MNQIMGSLRKKEQIIEYTQEIVSRLSAESSFHEFVKQSWPQVEGRRIFVDGWHIQAICEHLEAVTRGDIRFLLINIPPGCCKSTLVSVLWPTWMWISRPETRFICTSYAGSLSTRDCLKSRRVIESYWFQKRWGHLFKLTKAREYRFENDKLGYRIATSIEGTGTGEGGDILISDDLNNVKDIYSDAINRRTLNYWRGVWQTRLRNEKGAIVNIQQRTNTEDVSGDILGGEANKDYIKLILPMEFESHRRATTIILPSTKGKVWKDPRKEDGELLWPEFKDKKAVESLKARLNRDEYAIAGQLQQRPAPLGGGIIKKSHFKLWRQDKTPDLLRIIQSWDTGIETEQTSSYSCCTTWGIFQDDNRVSNVILLGMFRERLEYPDLRKAAKMLSQDYRYNGEKDFQISKKHIPDMVLVEKKATGGPLIQDFRKAGINAIGFDPGKYGNKMTRVKLITHFIQAGRVWVPTVPPDHTSLRIFSFQTLDLLSMFPNKESLDVADTMAQTMLYLRDNGLLDHPDDEKDDGIGFKPKDIVF